MALNNMPVFYRVTGNDSPTIELIAEKLYQWDGTNGTPIEVIEGKSAMPPFGAPGEFQIWSDSVTLNYDQFADPAPMFFSDNGEGDNKILEIINHIARKLGQAEFLHSEYAKAWLFTVPGVYVNQDEVFLPQTDLLIHYDVATPAGFDEGTNTIKNISLNPGSEVLDLAVLGGPANIDANGFVTFDGASTYAESQADFSAIWNYMDLNTNKEFTLYGSFYSDARASAGISFGKFGGYDLFYRQSYDSPNAKFGVTDIWDDGDTNDFINYYPTVQDFGAQEGEWFQAGLRVSLNEDGSSNVEFLFNGKSLQTWLDEYSGPYESDGLTPLEAGPARFAYIGGTSKTAQLDWNVAPDSWKAGPFRMGRDANNGFYAPNKVSYFAHYSRSIGDDELLALHDYHQGRFADSANNGSISTTGIIGNGLIAELDSAHASSYSGTGNIWTDLTGNGHNATLIGSTYSSNDGGVFEFSTSEPSVSFNDSNSISEFSVNNNISENGGFTAQVWVYRDNLPSVNMIKKNGEYGIRTLRDEYAIGTNVSAGPYNTPVSHSQWQLITLQGFSIDPGADGYVSPTHPWAGQEQVAFRSYFNGIKNLNFNNPTYDYYVDGTLAPGSSTNNPLELATSSFSSNNFTGKIGAFYFYNRVLTDQEVVDNFNATKSRFGL